jgi:transcriptional regulator with XRE-family HTH domain
MVEQPYFGQRLRALRLERGLSQAALADGELSTGYLSRLESGSRPPTKRVVKHLANRLGVSPTVFENRATSSLANVLALVASSAPDPELVASLANRLTVDDDLDPALRWQILWLLAKTRGDQGQLDEQRELLVDLVVLSDDLGSADLQVRTRSQLSGCARKLGHYGDAQRHAQEALDLAVDVAVADRAEALRALVSAEAEAGLLAEARVHADELCELTEGTGGAMAAEALWTSATVRMRRSDYTGAREVIERALALVNSRTDLMLWMRLRLAAASLYLQLTPPLLDEARARLDETMTALDLVGTDLHHQQLVALRAHLAFAEGQVDDARALCDSLAERPSLLSFRDRIRLQTLHNHLRIIGGEVDEGVAALQELASEAEHAKNVDLAAEIWRTLAQALTRARSGGRRTDLPPLASAESS